MTAIAEGTRSRVFICCQRLSGEQVNSAPFKKLPTTRRNSQKLQNCVSNAQDNFRCHGTQKDPEYRVSLDGTSAGPTDIKVDQQQQLQEESPMFGEAAVHAVMAARKLRRKQQNAERECQLSKIRVEYAKERMAVEETVRNRLLQESSIGMPKQISAEQEKLKPRASSFTSNIPVRP